MSNIMLELRQRQEQTLSQAQAMVTAAETEDRDFTPDEQTTYDGLLATVEQLRGRIGRLEGLGAQTATSTRQAPAVLSIPRGDNETRALAHFVRTGNTGHLGEMRTEMENGAVGVSLRIPTAREMRAVTDSTMNITTAADGQYAVPTGFVRDVAKRKSEMMLADRLGCLLIPGKGTTVNYPNEASDPQSFVATNEQSDAHDVAWSRNAPQLGVVAYTLLMYTRAVELTAQLMRDEDVNLMGFLADRISREYAQTHNALLITEAAASGTALKTYASGDAIAAGEVEDMVYHDTLSYYLDEGNSNAWVTRPSTFGNIASITGNARLYAETPGGSFARELLGYPVLYSNQVTATATSAKDLYFGNWYHMGYREDPTINLLVNPYRSPGLTILEYSFGAVYKLRQAGALGYGVHPSA